MGVVKMTLLLVIAVVLISAGINQFGIVEWYKSITRIIAGIIFISLFVAYLKFDLKSTNDNFKNNAKDLKVKE